jgi:hypothetical protein
VEVSNEEGWNVQPSQWELAVGVTNPFMGVPMYAEGTIGWGPGWTDFQVSGFYGPGVGKKVEGTVRESPRTPGLVAESKAAVTYGIGKAEVGFQSDFQGEVPGNVKLSLGPVAETGTFEVAPNPQWNGWDRTSAAKPSTPTAGLGFSAAVGGRYSSEVVNFADGISGLANDIASLFSGVSTSPAAPAPGPTPTQRSRP